MTDSDVEARVHIAKKSMWQSIFANPKVLFIAFFASYVDPHLKVTGLYAN